MAKEYIYLLQLSVVKGQVSQVETGEVEELTDPRGKNVKRKYLTKYITNLNVA